MARYRYRNPRRHYLRDVGRQRALQHIEDYRRLEAELGGTIEDVKQYLFSLPPHQLRAILDAYGKENGTDARAYAEKTLRKWQTGTVQMSGTVAERLFKLMPPRMPLSAKYQLVENLWSHVGPKSKKILRVGLDANVEQVMKAVHKHMNDVVMNYRIPEQLERRFNWLSAGDSHVKQDFLNHLQQYEKELVTEGARIQLPMMLDHLRSEAGQYTHRLAQVLRIGNHELEVTLDKSASGVAVVESWAAHPTAAMRQSTGYKWLWWVAAAIVVLWLAMHK
jgi:hypothetical protein